jgi:DNA-binding NtrC family response regulator
VKDIEPRALDLLAGYSWPGNVRQLQNALFRASVLCEGELLRASDFPQLAEQVGIPGPAATAQPGPATQQSLSGDISLLGPDGKLRRLEDMEAEIIRKAIHHCRGRMSEVARSLGIGRSTLYRKLGEMAVTDDMKDDEARDVA